MKLLINCSDLRGTGVCQVAASFINECRQITGNDYVIFIADPVKRNIDMLSFPSNFKFYEFDNKAVCSLTGWPNILKMKKIEAAEKPDVTFSVFGPSFWRPKSPHLQGYAYPHYVYPDSPIWKLLPIKDKIMIGFRRLIHINQLRNNGDYFVCETDDTKERWCSMYGISEKKAFTVYNTASAPFLSYKSNLEKSHDNEFRFFTLCSPYRHKNLQILNEVCPLLPQLNIDEKIRFYTTLPEESLPKIFNSEARQYVVNLGPQKVADCPAIVDTCDALFLPTLLECYSASYPEAMAMGKPILTSNLPFATTVCQDAALYFDPLNAQDILKKILEVVTNKQLYSSLQEKGKKRLTVFGTAHDRAVSYLKICHEISKENIVK